MWWYRGEAGECALFDGEIGVKVGVRGSGVGVAKPERMTVVSPQRAAAPWRWCAVTRGDSGVFLVARDIALLRFRRAA